MSNAEIDLHLEEQRAAAKRAHERLEAARASCDANNVDDDDEPDLLTSMRFEAVEKMLGLVATLRTVPGDTRVTIATRLGEVRLACSLEHEDDQDAVPHTGYASVGFFEGPFHGLVTDDTPRIWRILSWGHEERHLAIYCVGPAADIEIERIDSVTLEWVAGRFDDEDPLWEVVIGQAMPTAA